MDWLPSNEDTQVFRTEGCEVTTESENGVQSGVI